MKFNWKISLIFVFYILVNLFISGFAQKLNNIKRKLCSDNYISIRIKEMGKNKILNVFPDNIPSEILLNGNIISFTKESNYYRYKNTQYTMFTFYIFTNEINQEVIIKWNKAINNMHKMFYDFNSVTQYLRFKHY